MAGRTPDASLESPTSTFGSAVSEFGKTLWDLSKLATRLWPECEVVKELHGALTAKLRPFAAELPERARSLFLDLATQFAARYEAVADQVYKRDSSVFATDEALLVKLDAFTKFEALPTETQNQIWTLLATLASKATGASVYTQASPIIRTGIDELVAEFQGETPDLGKMLTAVQNKFTQESLKELQDSFKPEQLDALIKMAKVVVPMAAGQAAAL